MIRPAHCPAPLQDTHPPCPALRSCRGLPEAGLALCPVIANPSFCAREGTKAGTEAGWAQHPRDTKGTGTAGAPGLPREHKHLVTCSSRPPLPLWRQPPRASHDVLLSPASEDGPLHRRPGRGLVALHAFLRAGLRPRAAGPVQGCVTRPKSAFLSPTLSVH